jgi:hypothetical protein
MLDEQRGLPHEEPALLLPRAPKNWGSFLLMIPDLIKDPAPRFETEAPGLKSLHDSRRPIEGSAMSIAADLDPRFGAPAASQTGWRPGSCTSIWHDHFDALANSWRRIKIARRDLPLSRTVITIGLDPTIRRDGPRR